MEDNCNLEKDNMIYSCLCGRNIKGSHLVHHVEKFHAKDAFRSFAQQIKLNAAKNAKDRTNKENINSTADTTSSNSMVAVHVAEKELKNEISPVVGTEKTSNDEIIIKSESDELQEQDCPVQDLTEITFFSLDKRFRCPECNENNKSFIEMTEHIMKAHPASRNKPRQQDLKVGLSKADILSKKSESVRQKVVRVKFVAEEFIEECEDTELLQSKDHCSLSENGISTINDTSTESLKPATSSINVDSNQSSSDKKWPDDPKRKEIVEDSGQVHNDSNISSKTSSFKQINSSETAIQRVRISCDLCNIKFHSGKELKRHKKSHKHREMKRLSSEANANGSESPASFSKANLDNDHQFLSTHNTSHVQSSTDQSNGQNQCTKLTKSEKDTNLPVSDIEGATCDTKKKQEKIEKGIVDNPRGVAAVEIFSTNKMVSNTPEKAGANNTIPIPKTSTLGSIDLVPKGSIASDSDEDEDSCTSPEEQPSKKGLKENETEKKDTINKSPNHRKPCPVPKKIFNKDTLSQAKETRSSVPTRKPPVNCARTDNASDSSPKIALTFSGHGMMNLDELQNNIFARNAVVDLERLSSSTLKKFQDVIEDYLKEIGKHDNGENADEAPKIKEECAKSIDVKLDKQANVESASRNNIKVSRGRRKGKQGDSLRKFLAFLLDNLMKKDEKNYFREPIAETFAPGYNKLVKEPMDFSTMENKLDRGQYQTLLEFKEDFFLICENCHAYNKPGTVYHTAATKLKNHGLQLLSDDHLKALVKDMPLYANLSPLELGFDILASADNDQDKNADLSCKENEPHADNQAVDLKDSSPPNRTENTTLKKKSKQIKIFSPKIKEVEDIPTTFISASERVKLARRSNKSTISPLKQTVQNASGSVKRKEKVTEEKKSKRQKVNFGKQQGDENYDIEEQCWVQCCICHKWRTVEHMQEEPKFWECAMNKDPEHNSCEAEEEEWSNDEQYEYSGFFDGSNCSYSQGDDSHSNILNKSVGCESLSSMPSIDVDELLQEDSEEDHTLPKYKKPNITSRTLVELALRKLDPEHKGSVPQEEVQAFISWIFPYYSANEDQCRIVVDENLSKMSENSFRYVPAVAKQLGKALKEEKECLTKTCANIQHFEDLVDTYMQKSFPEPEDAPLCPTDIFLLHLLGADHPVDILEVKFSMIFKYPKFYENLKGWKEKVSNDIGGLRELDKVDEKKRTLYSIHVGFRRYILRKLIKNCQDNDFLFENLSPDLIEEVTELLNNELGSPSSHTSIEPNNPIPEHEDESITDTQGNNESSEREDKIDHTTKAMDKNCSTMNDEGNSEKIASNFNDSIFPMSAEMLSYLMIFLRKFEKLSCDLLISLIEKKFPKFPGLQEFRTFLINGCDIFTIESGRISLVPGINVFCNICLKLWCIENLDRILRQNILTKEALTTILPSISMGREQLLLKKHKEIAEVCKHTSSYFKPCFDESRIIALAIVIISEAARDTNSNEIRAEHSEIVAFINIFFPYYMLSRAPFELKTVKAGTIYSMKTEEADDCKFYFQDLVQKLDGKLRFTSKPELLNIFLPPNLSFAKPEFILPEQDLQLLVALAILHAADRHGWCLDLDIAGFIELHFPACSIESVLQSLNSWKGDQEDVKRFFNIRSNLDGVNSQKSFRIKPENILCTYSLLVKSFPSSDEGWESTRTYIRCPTFIKTILSLSPPAWQNYYVLQKKTLSLTFDLQGNGSGNSPKSLGMFSKYLIWRNIPVRSDLLSEPPVGNGQFEEDVNMTLEKPQLDVHVVIGISLLLNFIQNSYENSILEDLEKTLNQANLMKMKFQLTNLIHYIKTVFKYYSIEKHYAEFLIELRQPRNKELFEKYFEKKSHDYYSVIAVSCGKLFQEILLNTLDTETLRPSLQNPYLLDILTRCRSPFGDTYITAIGLLYMGDANNGYSLPLNESLFPFLQKHASLKKICLSDTDVGTDVYIELLSSLIDNDIFYLDGSNMKFKEGANLDQLLTEIGDTIQEMLRLQKPLPISQEILSRVIKLKSDFEIPREYLLTLALNNLNRIPGGCVPLSDIWSFIVQHFPRYGLHVPWRHDELAQHYSNRFVFDFSQETGTWTIGPSAMFEEMKEEVENYIRTNSHLIQEMMAKPQLLDPIMWGLFPVGQWTADP